METKLLYLKDFSALSCEARVIAVARENEKDAVALDATVFYPQGGGQPYDTGMIESPAGKLIVEEVRFADGAVRHIGRFERGGFSAGDTVQCRVDAQRRMLHSRIHSAGHLLDWAITELEPAWTPDPRGYHYPNGPYVTYAGGLEGRDKEKLKTDLEAACNRRIAMGGEVGVRFMNQEEMKTICRSMPDLPEGKSGRVIMFGEDFGVPCGGTHIKNLSEIRILTIRKIKQEGSNIRVGYDMV